MTILQPKFAACPCQILFLIFLPLLLNAQNEVQREQSSLRGIASMGFTVNVESNISLNETGELEVTSITDKIRKTLKEGDVILISDEQVRSSDRIPFLYMHINTMDAGQGLVPFSISLRFYQPVKLTLNQDQPTSASTWETGMVGIVSYDQMYVIQEAAFELIREFISDLRLANS